MATAKNNTALYVIIAVLIMCLAASIGYNFGNVNATASPNSTASMNAINSKVLKEIEELKSIYDTKIAEKKATYNDLETEKAKVQKLLAELEQTKGNANALLKYKEEYQNLEAKMRVLVDEIVVLKSSKSKAVTKVKATKPVTLDSKKPALNSNSFAVKNPKKATNMNKSSVNEANQVVETPQPKTEVAKPRIDAPEKKVEKVYASLDVSNLKAGGYISKSDTAKEETNSASKTDLIKISFYIEGNPNAKAEEKKYYIQVVDANNKVLGKRITEFFDDRSITYSLAKTIQYDNQYVAISQELLGSKFEKGTYTVNVYERSRLVAKTSFTLK